MTTRNKICKRTLLNNGVIFTFTNDKELKVNPNDFSEEMLKKLAQHGMSQKIGDAFSSYKSANEAYEAALEVYNMLIGDDWTAKRSASSLVVTAIARRMEIELDDAKELWESKTEEQQKLIAKNNEIKSIIAKIQAERAEAKLKQAQNNLSDNNSEEALDLGELL